MLRQKILDLKGKVIIMVSEPSGGYKDSELAELINLSDSMPQYNYIIIIMFNSTMMKRINRV